MKPIITITTFCLLMFLQLLNLYSQKIHDQQQKQKDLQILFKNPQQEFGTWVLWWWLNGYVSKQGIIRELDEMADKGISGAIVFHCGLGYTPEHTPFMSEQWREYFRFAVVEAAKRGITISVNICEGWNAGGPWVTEDHASVILQYSKLILEGPCTVDTLLPDLPNELHRHDLFTFAWSMDGKSCDPESFKDVTKFMEDDGRFRWTVPDGQWLIVRFGRYINEWAGFIKLSNDGRWISENYFETNEMDREGMDIHFNHTAKILINDVKPYAGTTFTHLHIDSGETGRPDWTPAFFSHFERLRGYDPRPFMAAKAGLLVTSSEITERFMEDYRRTQGDLITGSYYGRLTELASEYGMGTHSEAAGYQKPTVDALRAMGINSIAMSEFWSRNENNYIHQASQGQLKYHDGIRNAASAAHTYGLKIVQAEAYTVFPNINYTVPLYGLKDIGDRAFCQGLNRTVLHHFVHQPECEKAMPGYAWPNCGISFSVNRTWWKWSGEWFAYLNRCHLMLQHGRSVADVCYFQGEGVPSYVPAKWHMDPSLPKGYDCDVLNVNILVERAEVNEIDELVLPGGTTYRYLVLNQGGNWQYPPDDLFKKANTEPYITEWPQDLSGNKPLPLSLSTLHRLKELVNQGVTLIGPPPDRATGLSGYPECDEQIRTLAVSIWGENPGNYGQREIGKGRVIWGKKLGDIIAEDGLLPDLEYIEDTETSTLPLPVETASAIPDPAGFDWIHRQAGDTDYYFLANLRNAEASGEFTFRQNGRQPELWDPLNGEIRDLYEYQLTTDGRISIPLKFAPRQSFFVVFRKTSALPENIHIPNFPVTENLMQLEGEWTVYFDTSYGGPAETLFEHLTDWGETNNDSIRYYSGIARYMKDFIIKPKLLKPERQTKYLLDLGRIEVMARVHLNGKELCTLWTAPWQADITESLKPGKNRLEIEVVNLWRNRLIGDAGKPEEERLTYTNIFNIKKDEELLPSGLIGPVVVKKTIINIFSHEPD